MYVIYMCYIYQTYTLLSIVTDKYHLLERDTVEANERPFGDQLPDLPP